MINEYRNAIRDLINKNIQQGTLNNLIVWDVRSDEAQDPTLLSLRIYGSVHCHTGSLEMNCLLVFGVTMCSLPYRQLRNQNNETGFFDECSLPYRQLRN